MRLAAIADLHACQRRPETLAARLATLRDHADVLLVAGDVTDTGEPHEARAVAAALAGVGVPIVAVLGNHDHDRGAIAEVRAVLEAARWIVLDGEAVRLGDLGVAGTKGFCAGFGKRRVTAFGEAVLKRFVAEAADENARLQRAVHALETQRRVIMTHYAPIPGTLVGESPEIFPFLGDGQLAQVADAVSADAYVHGHAHFGRPEGRTPGGVPVYNCSLVVLDAQRPALPYRLVELAGEIGPPERCD